MDEYSYSAEILAIFTEEELVLNYSVNVKNEDSYTLYPGEEKGEHLQKRRIYEGDLWLFYSVFY